MTACYYFLAKFTSWNFSIRESFKMTCYAYINDSLIRVLGKNYGNFLKMRALVNRFR